MPPLLLIDIALVLPHAHAIPHDPLDDADIMGPLWSVVCDLDKRVVALLSIRLFHDALFVVGDFFAGPFEKFSVYEGWEGPRWTARGDGLVCGEFKTDEYAASIGG